MRLCVLTRKRVNFRAMMLLSSSYNGNARVLSESFNEKVFLKNQKFFGFGNLKFYHYRGSINNQRILLCISCKSGLN